MIFVRIVAFLTVLVLVLGTAVAVQNQALLVPRVGFLQAAAGPDQVASARDCLYLGARGLQTTPRRGESCSLLMDSAWQADSFWSRAEASVRARARQADPSDGD